MPSGIAQLTAISGVVEIVQIALKQAAHQLAPPIKNKPAHSALIVRAAPGSY
jgi:hypothetical protein